MIGGLLGRLVDNLGKGGVGGSSGVEEAFRGRDQFRCGPWPLLASGSEKHNGSWALTSDQLPSSPRPVQSHSGMAGRV